MEKNFYTTNFEVKVNSVSIFGSPRRYGGQGDILSGSDEEGIYYGLNLSATEFQVSRVQLGQNNAPIVKQESKTVAIPSNPRQHAFSEELLNYIATELVKFMETERESFDAGIKRSGELGFTYSFPLEQDQISSGAITKSKSPPINDTVGMDVMDKFNKALEKHRVDETVGNLVCDRNYNENVVVAITLAMGTDATYVNSVSEISNFNGTPPTSGEMVSNSYCSPQTTRSVTRIPSVQV